MSKLVTEQEKFEKLNEIIASYPKDRSYLIQILQEVQAEYRYLPEEVLAHISTSLGLSAATVYGVATFYAQFSLSPKGEYVVKCCDGTACHVRLSMPVYDAIRKRVGLVDGKFTTSDLKFTVETVSCLGACGLAPVITINDEVYGKVTPEAALIIIDKLLERDGDN
jgi:NADH:ubiquinone oxidoreductase 24 kD subunit